MSTTETPYTPSSITMLRGEKKAGSRRTTVTAPSRSGTDHAVRALRA